MKIQSFFFQTFIVLTTFLLLSCSDSDKKDELTILEKDLTYKEKEMIFLKEFREKVRKDWKVEKMVIDKGSQNDSKIVMLDQWIKIRMVKNMQL